MAQNSTDNKESFKSFEQKVINRSVAQLLCFQKLADYLLECCSAEAKPNTLSFCSFLPLLIVSIFATPKSSLWFLIAAIAIFLHQILDIANKKQAYRLSVFSFGTYYVDHVYDSFSCILIVHIVGILLDISYNWIWFSIFAFAILPFYIHHLAMYYNQYMCFHTISPQIQGLILLQILFVIFSISPSILSFQIIKDTLSISHILIAIATIWLIVFLIIDLKTIYIDSAKVNETFAFKNLFVIFVLGYIMFQNAVIKEDILKNYAAVFHLFTFSLMLCFSLIIGELIIKYAENKKFQQISLNTLFFTAWIVLIYAICAFATFEEKTEKTIAIVMGAILLLFEIVYFFYRNRQIMREINEALGG